MTEGNEEYHLDLAGFQKRYGDLDPEAFAAEFSHPFLLFQLTGDKPPKNMESYADSTAAEMATAHLQSSDAGTLGIYIAPIFKSDRNKVANSIFVGRKPWCDIVVPHKMMSKMHAFFRGNDDGFYTIADLASKFGTLLRDEKLPPNQPAQVRSRDKIEFAGAVPAWFLDPADLYEQKEILLAMMPD